MFRLGKKKKFVSAGMDEIQYDGKTQEAMVLVPYGTFVNAVNEAIVGILSDHGREESLLAMPFDPDNFDKMEEGEVGFGIPSEKNRLYFRQGKIVFKIDDQEGGDYAVRYNELKTAFDKLKEDFNNLVTVFNSHTQPVSVNITTGIGTASAPVTPGQSSTADMSNAKIEKMEVPKK